MLNKVTLIGYLGSDAETPTTRNDSVLTVLSLATKRSWKNRETGAWESQTTWHRCVCFGAVASWAAGLTKGSHVQIVGEIQNRDYAGKDALKSQSPRSAFSALCASIALRRPPLHLRRSPHKRPHVSLFHLLARLSCRRHSRIPKPPDCQAFADSVQHSGGNRLDQSRAPPGLKALAEPTFHPGTEHCGQHLNQRVDRFIIFSKPFDLPNRVQHRRVVPTVIEPADPGRAPATDVLRQVHGNLTAETGTGLVPLHTTAPEMNRYLRFDLFQRQPPDSCFLIKHGHHSLDLAKLRSHDRQTDPYRPH